MKRTVQVAGGQTVEIDTVECRTCDGTGILGKDHTYESRRIDESSSVVRTARAGDRCPACVGNGWVGRCGTVEPDPRSLN
jgi:hypothetical protein